MAYSELLLAYDKRNFSIVEWKKPVVDETPSTLNIIGTFSPLFILAQYQVKHIIITQPYVLSLL